MLGIRLGLVQLGKHSSTTFGPITVTLHPAHHPPSVSGCQDSGGLCVLSLSSQLASPQTDAHIDLDLDLACKLLVATYSSSLHLVSDSVA